MSEINDEQVPGLAEQAAREVDDPNLLGQLAAKRREISTTRETFIPVPGYDREPPLLLIKYRLLEGPELTMIGEKIRREVRGSWDRQMFAAVDTFIAACVGIFVDKGDGKPVPVTYEGFPITGFNEDLAKALQFRDELPDPPSARSVVFGLFASNDVAISQHNYVLNRWFSDTSINVSEEMLAGNL